MSCYSTGHCSSLVMHISLNNLFPENRIIFTGNNPVLWKFIQWVKHGSGTSQFAKKLFMTKLIQFFTIKLLNDFHPVIKSQVTIFIFSAVIKRRVDVFIEHPFNHVLLRK